MQHKTAKSAISGGRNLQNVQFPVRNVSEANLSTKSIFRLKSLSGKTFWSSKVRALSSAPTKTQIQRAAAVWMWQPFFYIGERSYEFDDFLF